MLILLAMFNFAFKLEGIGNERFTIFYPAGYQQEAQLTLTYLEQYYRHADQITGNRPGRLTVVIEDIGTESNGFTDPVAAAVHLYANIPYPEFHFGAMRSWWRTASLHEYTHYSHLANVRGLVRYLRYPLGKVWLPGAVSALYMYEGVTVLSESSILPYEGRLNEGYFDAYTNLRAAEDRLPSQNYLAHVPDDYPAGDLPYLIGSEFTEFLSALAADEDTADYAKLGRYYDHYAGCCLLNVIGYDYSAKKVWGRDRNGLYQVWKKHAVSNAQYRQITGRTILTGYSLAYLAASDQGLYVYRQNNFPMAYDFSASYGELLFIDPGTGESKLILRGSVSLPARIEGGDIYVAISDLRPNAKNYSLYGYGYVSTILRIRNGHMKKLLTGEIKAFAVSDGVLYHARKNKLGSDIYVKNAKYFHFDSLLVQDMAFRDNGDLVFIGFREADGNNLYVLTADRVLKQLTDQDFSFSGLSVTANDVYFSANYGNAWQPYRMNLDDGEIYLLAGDGLAAYPVEFKDKLYYITIGDGKEVLKEVAGEEQVAAWPGTRDRISIPALVPFTGKSVWENAWSLIWPDLSLPYYIPGMDDQPGFAGLVMIGHDALGVHQYNFNLLSDSTFHYDAVWNYRAFPPLSATIRINDQPDLTAGLFDLLCWLRNAGLLRSISLSSAFYPYTEDIDGLISLRLKPGETARLDMYAAGFFPMKSDNGLVGRAGLSFYWPLRFGVLVSRFQAGYAAESLSVVLPSGAELIGIYGAKAGLRFTLPVAAPRWGIDFPHLFIERIWASLEAQAGTASDQLAAGSEPIRYNYLGYLTLNMSVLNGFLKIRPSMGAVFDPVADKKFTPFFSITTDLLALLDRMENRHRMARTIDRFPENGYQQ